MSDRPPQGLLDYYNAELTYLHTVGSEFAAAHPQVAARLRLGAHECADPHVERLIESFAFLTARLQRTLDLEVPGISSALLEVLYPNYLDPVPPMSVAEFEVDPSQGRLSSGYQVPSGTPLFAEMGAGEVPTAVRDFIVHELFDLGWVAEPTPAAARAAAVAQVRLTRGDDDFSGQRRDARDVRQPQHRLQRRRQLPLVLTVERRGGPLQQGERGPLGPGCVNRDIGAECPQRGGRTI